MLTAENALVSCSSSELLVATINHLGIQLPLDDRKKLVRAYLRYANEFGDSGAFLRMNGQFVSQIISNVSSLPPLQPLATGEIDGKTFNLYEKPVAESAG